VLLEQANQSLGRLDGLAAILPGLDVFLYAYVRKEAVLSSQIEGTQSSLSDLLMFEVDEAPGVPLDDVQEVSSYVTAMNYGLTRLREGFPLSLRLIREIHDVLLRTGRRRQTARRVSHQPELDRRHAAWKCVLRSASARPGDGLHGRA